MLAPRLLCVLTLAGFSGCNLFATPCDVDTDCPEGACVVGFCDASQEPSSDAGAPPSDAGAQPADGGLVRDGGPLPDAGMRDAGAPDAGAPDAGVDSGPQPSFASTLDDEAAVIMPLRGASTGYDLIPPAADAFFADLVATPPHIGLLLDAPSERLRLPLAFAGSINGDLQVGTFSFDVKPLYLFDDDDLHPLFAIEGGAGGAGLAVRARKAGGGNSNELQLTVTDGVQSLEVSIPTATFRFERYVWYRVTCTWDLRDDSPELHFYVDGVQEGFATATNLQLVMAAPDASQTLSLGGWVAVPNKNAFALFDNLEVWTEVRPPNP